MRGCETQCRSYGAKRKQSWYLQCDKWASASVYRGFRRRPSAWCNRYTGGGWRQNEKGKHALKWKEEALHEMWVTQCGSHSQGWRLASLSGCIHSCWLKAVEPAAPIRTGRKRGGWPRTGRTGETRRHREGFTKRQRKWLWFLPNFYHITDFHKPRWKDDARGSRKNLFNWGSRSRRFFFNTILLHQFPKE